MNAYSILSNFIFHVTPDMHGLRRNALVDLTDSLLSGSHLTVTDIGRGLKGSAYEKHKIKKADRMLSNSHLQTERRGIYQAITSLFASHLPRPLILVDWSDLDPAGQFFLLRASLPFSGRSITLYEEVHTLATKEKARTHQQFLETLSTMFPQQSKPVIVTDAGFRVPWFQAVLSLGWDFIGRIRGRSQCQKNIYSQWVSCKTLYDEACPQPKHSGRWKLTLTKQFPVHMVIIKEPGKGRHAKNPNGTERQSAKSRQIAQRESEPWLLATSLSSDSPATTRYIVNSYKTRMQIEEGFRDLKSIRWGFSGNLQATRKCHRLNTLILIASLAQVVTFLLGITATVTGQARRYQCNTQKRRAVISICFLGLRIWRGSGFRFKQSDWQAVIREISKILRNYHSYRYG